MVRRMLIIILSTVAAGYFAILVLLYTQQRSMIFPAPENVRSPSYPQAAVITIPPTAEAAFEGKALYLKAPEGGRTLVHFHGNAEQIADMTDMLSLAQGRGMGFFAPEYPGYGLLATKTQPSQDAIFAGADAALRHLTQTLGVPSSTLTVQGQSLGSGVAVEMAARGYGSRLVLISAYTAISDVAAEVYPWLPVRALVKDPFNSAARASAVNQPVLLAHARADDTIPYQHSVALAKRFKTAELFTPERGGHNDVWIQADLIDAVFRFATKR